MEVNTRLQVEHTVTEMLTGIDIVRQQILIAEQRRLELPRERVQLVGKAVQVRINAEDPKNNFMPEGGKRVEVYQSPGGPRSGWTVSSIRAMRFPTDLRFSFW